MKTRRRTKGVSCQEPLLKEGEKIYLYKRGSYGEVVGIYNSVKEISSKELVLNGRFRSTTINNCLQGINKVKYFTSKYHGCKVRPIIKKIE